MFKSTRCQVGFGPFNLDFQHSQPDHKAMMVHAFTTVVVSSITVAIEYGPHVKDWWRNRESKHDDPPQPQHAEHVFSEDVSHSNGKSEGVPTY